MNSNKERADVLKLVVLQAWAGAPWWITCTGLMSTHDLTQGDVERELKRLRDWQAFVDPQSTTSSTIKTDLPENGGFQGVPEGVDARSIVFDVIVQQAMAGAPWKEICAGPMEFNRILPDEVEAEVRRRGGDSGLAGAPVPRRPSPPLGGEDISLPLPQSGDELQDRHESGTFKRQHNGPYRTPPRPTQ